ncbi:hypothetical protein DRN80_02955 [Methanosarcinales archaeon]|nr:MAG: hypothetical protein DRN80_02955 [Methanosarcinales archaeon]
MILQIAILIVLLLISVGSYLYFLTPIFYDEISLDPIKTYYRVSKAEADIVNISISVGEQEQPTIASKQRNPISYIKFGIREPLKRSTSEFKIKVENFTKEIDFWEDANGFEQTFNRSKAEEYMRKNVPDYLITASFIKNGSVHVWSQVWQSQPSMSVNTEPFLKQTSFGVWEGQYFFDTQFSGTHLNNETYLPASVQNIIFEVNIPENFKIENTEDINLEKISNGYLLTKELKPGKTFHLVIKDSKKEIIKMVISFLSPALFGIVLGMLIQKWLNLM